MFASVIITAVFASALVVAVPIAQRSAPTDWATDYLEAYSTYHTRYLALGCTEDHNTNFFNECCHPLLCSEPLSDRPAYCTPNVTQSSSASEYAATATTPASADVDAATQYGDATAYVASVIESISATASPSGSTTYSIPQPTSWTTSTTTTSSTPASSPSSGSSGGSVQTGGVATYFTQNGVAGACGIVHPDSALIVAIDKGYWPGYESGDASPLCGRSLTITNTDNGNTVTATVQDVCPTCDNLNSLDLSSGAFLTIAGALAVGEVPITWVWD